MFITISSTLWIIWGLHLAACPKDAVHVRASLKPGWKYEIQSPGFPSNYQPNQTCKWKVFFPEYVQELHKHYRMMLVFDALEIEPCGNCACDWFEYSDRENNYKKCELYSKNAIATLKETGSSKARIYSLSWESQKEVWLQFHSDGFFRIQRFQR